MGRHRNRYDDYGYSGYGFKPYVPVAQRRAQAEREAKRLKKQGQTLAPVLLEGREIAGTFWGKSWCDNLERYSDFANRLPRGRTYVRNGSVVDLQIEPGEVRALVSGSSLYKVRIRVKAVPAARWSSLCRDCAQGIDSLVDLLQGRFSKGVMERLCRQGTGLFPVPAEIEMDCSCPDWASMCKHVAAVLYGVGARLDRKPELLFTLRQVEQAELLASAGKELPLARTAPASKKVLGGEALSDLFGIDVAPAELSAPPAEAVAPAAPAAGRGSRSRKPAARTRKAPSAGATRAAKPAAKTKSAAPARKPVRKQPESGSQKVRAPQRGRISAPAAAPQATPTQDLVQRFQALEGRLKRLIGR